MDVINQILQRWRIIPWIIIAPCLAVLCTWAMDMLPPFALHGYEPTAGRPGEAVTLRAKVSRFHRGCDAIYGRVLFDGGNVRHLIESPTWVSHRTIKQLDDMEPGFWAIAMRIPATAAPGSGLVQTTLAYRCNPLHAIWPIVVKMDIPITILK